MAIQTGLIHIRGTLGDVTFFKTTDGYKVKMKGGPTRQQFKRSRRFVRSRECSTEFTRATQAIKLIKDGIRPYLRSCADTRFYGRMTALLVKVVRSDSVNERGKRKLLPENLHLLRGFKMKKDVSSGVQIKTTIVNNGEVRIDASLAPILTREVAKAGATHVRMFVCVSSLDLEAEKNVTTIFSSKIESVQALTLAETFVYTGDMNDALLFFAGVEYMQFVNGIEERIVSVSAMEVAEVVG
jgi:hypothetical protein